MSTTSLIEQGNIFLRELDEQDTSEAYLTWLASPGINQFLEIRFSCPDDVNVLKKPLIEFKNNPRCLILSIFLQSNKKHIGNINNQQHQTANIGFLIGDSNEWGKDYASLAISMACQFDFANYPLEKIIAGCYEANKDSKRALIKAGFNQEGYLIDQWLVQRKRQNGLIFGKLKPQNSL